MPLPPHLASITPPDGRGKEAGFSLIELSIVLVILGLLVGGILTGQSLIRAAGLRSVTTEYTRYVTAANTFRDKYLALPGDMSNATSFWGDNNTACPDAAIPNGTPGTCNGNMNGLIDISEMFRFWQQLAMAGLLEGSYTGADGTAGTTTHHQRGINAPASKLTSSASWAVLQRGNVGNANMWQTEYLNNMFIGGETTTSWPDTPLLKPEEAWNIDTKMDDGMPGTGRIIGLYWPVCTTATTFTDYAATYKFTETANTCQVRFLRIF